MSEWGGVLAQKLQCRKSVLTTHYIGQRGSIRVFMGTEITHGQLFAEGELQAGEGVAHLHLGILTTLGHKPICTQITHRAETVGQPADLQTVADS